MDVVALVRRERYLMEFAANMAYRVELTARAAGDLEALYLEKNAAESPDAARWYNGLEQAVYTLERTLTDAQVPRRHAKLSANCGISFTAPSPTSTALFLKSMGGEISHGRSPFATEPENH